MIKIFKLRYKIFSNVKFELVLFLLSFKDE